MLYFRILNKNEEAFEKQNNQKIDTTKHFEW